MKKAVNQISKSPFTRGIEKAKLPRCFHQPTFAMYNGRTDPVELVSQFKQKMAVHSQDKAVMCRVFPSSLGPMPMRWFDGLRKIPSVPLRNLPNHSVPDSLHTVGFLNL